MTLTDPNTVFKVMAFLKSNISKRCILRTKLLKNTTRKPYTIYRMIPLSITLSDLWPRFQGHDIFSHWLSQNDTTYSPSYYRMSIGCCMRSIAWWHFQWPWRTPNPVFEVTAFLKSNIGKSARLKDKVTIAQEETIPSIRNDTMFGNLHWPLNASRGFVSISWASCIIT